MMFHNDAQNKCDNRHEYRNLILRSIASFFIGAILCALFQSLGLGGLLIGIALCFFAELFFCSK